MESDAEFVTYDEELRTLIFEGLSESDIGDYTVTLTLQDDMMGIQVYEIEVMVTKPELFAGVMSIEGVDENKGEGGGEEVEFIEESNPEFTIVTAKITEITNFGDVTVEFSEEMATFDYNKIDD